jgi:hypothetical protein
MALTDRENYLRTVTMTGGEWIPMHIAISGATWNQLRDDLEDVLVRHPHFYPGFEKGKQDWDALEYRERQHASANYIDNYGCEWHGEVDGITGIVDGHPLADWDAFDDYQMPDPRTHTPLRQVDWEQVRSGMAAAKERGALTVGGLEHGWLFMRLYYLRGFENLMMDMATEDRRLQKLVDMIVEYSRYIVNQYVEMGVDMFHFPEDLGAQDASIMGPKGFDRWIAPAYHSLMQPVRDAGIHVHMHSDGYILDIIDNILACGVNVINLQDLAHGIDNIARELKGRVCIDLDIDRQSTVPFGSRQEILDLIEEEVRVLGSPQGGLTTVIGFYPPTPAENVDAVLTALEKYQRFWWE